MVYLIPYSISMPSAGFIVSLFLLSQSQFVKTLVKLLNNFESIKFHEIVGFELCSNYINI